MKLIFFDIDNTLLKSCKTHSLAFIKAIEQVYKVKLNWEEFKKYNLPGMTDQEIILSVLEKAGVPEKVIQEKLKVCMNKVAYFFSVLLLNEKLTLLPGVKMALEKFRKSGVFMGIVTGNLESIAWKKLKKTKIAEYFAIGAFGSDHKDRTTLVNLALKRAKNYFNHTFSLHSTYLIGDTPRDIIAGKTIGVKTIAVATGSCSRESLLQFRPDLVLNNLAESQFFDLVLN